MTEYSFDEFEQGPIGRKGLRAHVSLNTRGYFAVNRKAILAMGEPDAVVLMFDRERNVIGMKRSPIDRKNAFRLEQIGRSGSGRIIYAANFCRHHKIIPSETIGFPAPNVNEDGIMLLDLNEATPVNTA